MFQQQNSLKATIQLLVHIISHLVHHSIDNPAPGHFGGMVARMAPVL